MLFESRLQDKLQEGLEKGLEEGRKEGLEEGIEKIIKVMYQRGKSIEEIAADTGYEINMVREIIQK